MTVLAGYSADRSGDDALALAAMLAGDGDLRIATVVPETWAIPSPARVDAEYGAFLVDHAQKTLARAQARLDPALAAETVWRAAPSAGVGLAALARESGAELIVLGSARDGPAGRCSFGTTAAGVLAESRHPVALAPRGLRKAPPARLRRVSCAFTAADTDRRPLTVAAALARRHGVPLRLVTFVVRDRQMYPSPAGYDLEHMVTNVWRDQAAAAQRAARDSLPAALAATAVMIEGASWKKAVGRTDWACGEILVAGAHPRRGLAFGAVFTRLLRHVRLPLVAVA